MMARRPHLDSVRRKAALAALVVAAASACSSGSDVDLGLSPQGEEGRAIADDSGCASCHGDVGEGGVGPAWTGLFNSSVPLESGEDVIADPNYLRRSIKDPGAEQVAGYTVQMPPNSLTDREIDAVITYIRELG